jgi:hypothetical protein
VSAVSFANNSIESHASLNKTPGLKNLTGSGELTQSKKKYGNGLANEMNESINLMKIKTDLRDSLIQMETNVSQK